MKILAFTDTHANPNDLKKILSKVKEKPDILISCGDLSFFGRGLDKVCKELNEIGLQILSIHGNHEGSEEMKRMYKKYKNFTDIHSGILEIDNFVFFGYGGGGFTKIDERFETIVRKVEREISKDKKLIFISHMPPYKTKLDYLDLDHVGSKSYRKFIEKNKPILVFSGHIDENAYVKDKVGETLIINPGPGGTIIELK